MIEIKHRWTGAVIKTVDADTLRGAALRGADLRGANLRGADLRGADLRGADLRGAALRGAALRGADLRGADLRGADLTGADLTGADVAAIRESIGLVIDPSLPAQIVAQIEAHPETWDQSWWHSECGSKHCIAGWATKLSGSLGKYMEANLGPATAAELLLWRPDCEMPSFAGEATTEQTLGRLRVMAAKAAEDAAKAAAPDNT